MLQAKATKQLIKDRAVAGGVHLGFKGHVLKFFPCMQHAHWLNGEMVVIVLLLAVGLDEITIVKIVFG